ncbi:MAG: hypothetical protein M1824_006262 [Vezdaea acicularis]|nr:MAG: hypothetical protein M1824_006262 [Vezdaea acicularis]
MPTIHRNLLYIICITIVIYIYTHQSLWINKKGSRKLDLGVSKVPLGSSGTPSIRPKQPSATEATVSSDPKISVKSKYTQCVVVARLKSEDVSWLERELPNIAKAVYTVDDPSAALQPPTNKGHESMVYLTYIIENYDNLPDTVIFIHSHQSSWHNNDLLDGNTGHMIHRLSNQKVAREGYFNLRCHLHPGCPEWLHLDTTSEDINKKEEAVFANVWDELHPGDPMPKILAQPCCAQFAASRDRIRSISLESWTRYQDWLLTTNLSDSLSGRIWEYTWQYVFTGNSTLCPPMNECYCDGYGVCFGSAANMAAWFDLRERQDELEAQLKFYREIGGEESGLREELSEVRRELLEKRDEAFRRGNDPKNRAAEMGRPWNPGDSF